jgi:hypothetical protein
VFLYVFIDITGNCFLHQYNIRLAFAYHFTKGLLQLFVFLVNMEEEKICKFQLLFGIISMQFK